MWNQLIENRVNQLEENYHFNLKDYSFEYKNKKAFIKRLTENTNIIWPFIHIRNQLGQITDELEGNKFNSPDQLYKFTQLSMQIIGNMLDSTKMGSIENYMNHIWKDYDIALESDTTKLMQDFVQLLADIITIIDCCCEIELSSMDDQMKNGLIKSSMIETLDPNIKVLGFTSISEDGSILKVNTGKKNTIEKYDLKEMKPLNTKEI